MSLISDIKTYKIKNGITFPFIFIGFLTNFVIDGWKGLFFSVQGCIIPVIFLLIFFMLKMLGAGDIKLFCAIGSIAGPKFVLYTMIYSFISGGIIALVLMVLRKNLLQRFFYFFRYLKICVLTLSLFPYTNFKDKSDGAKFRFAYGITIGTFIQLFIEILKM